MLKLTKNNLITFKTPFKNMLPGKLFIGLNTTRGKENLINQLSIVIQAITRSRAANSKKEVDTKANQRTTTKTSECVFHRKYF